MLILTLMLGLACQSAANLPDGQCNPPATQYAIATTEKQAKADLLQCQRAISDLQIEMDQRGATFDSLLYCDQRKVGQQR